MGSCHPFCPWSIKKICNYFPGESDEDDEEKDKNEDNAKTEKEQSLQEKRMEKKKKLKEMFNKQFDDAQERSYHDDLKMEADAQGEVSIYYFPMVILHPVYVGDMP